MEATQRNRCIGVFDSGLGGLTVVRRLMEQMPGEDIVYLGDSARVPYGTKSAETVRRFALQDAAFLMRFDPKLVVVACNTASASALEHLQGRLEVPVIGMIRPGAAAAAAQAPSGPFGVIATEGTIASGAYQRELAALAPGCEVLTGSCPLLVPIVEEGRGNDDPIVLHVLGDYLRLLQRKRPPVLVLGCTHYPLLTRAIAKLMGPDVALIDSGQAAALAVKRHLLDNDLAAPACRTGTLRCYSTDNPDRFAAVAGRFLGRAVSGVHWVGTDELNL